MQVGTVDQYQNKFKELGSNITIINPLLNETHYVGIFFISIRSELNPLVKLANLSTMLESDEVAKLYKESFKALIPFCVGQTFSNHYYKTSIHYIPLKSTSHKQ